MITKAKQNAKELDTLLTVKDVAEIYCLSTREVHRREAAGTIPKALTLGHHTKRWRASDIQAHLDSLRPSARFA